MKTLNKKFLKKNKSAFTLVELVIVITILAILAAIAFISFQGYTKDSRDTNRLTTINSLEKGLQIHQVKVGKLPLPENAINITYSGTVIGYQGIFGGNNSRLINMSKTPLDPLDDTSFTYNVNSDLNAYQITGFFESKSNLAENNLLQKTYAGNIDYSSRIVKSFGKELGVLLLSTGNDLNRPLQEKYNASSFTGIDVKTFNGTLPSLGNVGNLKAVFNNKEIDNIIGTGSNLVRLENIYKQKMQIVMNSCPPGWNDLGKVSAAAPSSLRLNGNLNDFKLCESKISSEISLNSQILSLSGCSDYTNLGTVTAAAPSNLTLNGNIINLFLCSKTNNTDKIFSNGIVFSTCPNGWTDLGQLKAAAPSSLNKSLKICKKN